jgi:hypothetical protein
MTETHKRNVFLVSNIIRSSQVMRCDDCWPHRRAFPKFSDREPLHRRTCKPSLFPVRFPALARPGSTNPSMRSESSTTSCILRVQRSSVFSDFKEWKTRENTQKSNKMGGELAVTSNNLTKGCQTSDWHTGASLMQQIHFSKQPYHMDLYECLLVV